jgi:hypothetical protein
MHFSPACHTAIETALPGASGCIARCGSGSADWSARCRITHNRERRSQLRSIKEGIAHNVLLMAGLHTTGAYIRIDPPEKAHTRETAGRGHRDEQCHRR